MLGLALKPDTDDVRDAPALYLIRAQIERWLVRNRLRPCADDSAERLLPASVRIVNSVSRASSCAYAAALMTKWQQLAAAKMYDPPRA